MATVADLPQNQGEARWFYEYRTGGIEVFRIEHIGDIWLVTNSDGDTHSARYSPNMLGSLLPHIRPIPDEGSGFDWSPKFDPELKGLTVEVMASFDNSIVFIPQMKGGEPGKGFRKVILTEVHQ